MLNKRPPLKIKNPAGNLILSLIAIIIALYFWFNPFGSKKNAYTVKPQQPETYSSPVERQSINRHELPRMPEDKSNEFPFDDRYESEYQKGLSFFQNGELEEAVKAVSKALEIKKTPEADETLQQLYNLLGLKMSKEGNYFEAIKFYDEAIKISPKKELLIAKSNTYLLYGRTEEAISFLESYLPSFETDPDYLVVIGNIVLENGDIKKAYEIEEKAASLNAGNINTENLRRKIETATGIISSMVEYGKTVTILKTEHIEDKLTEDFIYSACGEAVGKLKSHYQFGFNGKITILITSAPDALWLNSGSLIYAAGDYANQIPLFRDSIDIQNKNAKSNLKYLVSKSIFSDYTGNPGKDLFHEGAAIKISGISLSPSGETDTMQMTELPRLNEALSANSLPADEKSRRSYNQLALSLVEYIEFNYSPAAVGRILTVFKENITLQYAISSVIKKGHDPMLSEWQKHIRSQNS